ncbi:bacterio-opsin activator domain-containing protein [Natrialbaceae archaeon A-arb3/5]
MTQTDDSDSLAGDGLIVYVTDDRDRKQSLCHTLRERLDRPVQSVSRDELADLFETQCPDAVVFAVDDPAVARDCLEYVETAAIGVTTIVTPQNGSEELATVALRSDATEYVPEACADPAERIIETVRSQSETRTISRSSYHRILANELPDEAFVIAEDGTYLEAKSRPESHELYRMPPDELPGMTLEETLSSETATTVQECLDRTIQTGEQQSIEYDVETTDGWRRLEGRVVPIDEWIDGQRAVVLLARDITERAQRENQLRSRQAQLETLNRINAVVRQVIETLVEAPGRDAIERDVCQQLVDSELYCGSLIAERTATGELSYRTSAGEATTYLGYVREENICPDHPFERAAETGDIQAVTHVLEREPFAPPLQDAARVDDVRAAIAVPITHEDATFGVLTVLASRADAFSDSEQAGFALLGETIGFTIMAVKNRQLLFADTVVELEFRIDGGDTFAFHLSEQYDCTCSLEWAGTTTSGQSYQFVTVDGLDGETVIEAAADHDSVEECRLIHDGDERCTIEIRLRKSGVRTLTNHGVTIRDVTVEDNVGTCLVEVSQTANVREIADALAGIYERTELVARREVDRTVRTAAERRNRILDELTDRQLATLRLAYYSGFFEWPRESTGEDIASAMNVSPPTMHQHLRKGLETILSEFFESGSGAAEVGGQDGDETA